jgi:RNA polymerase sigma-70 factor (sigma-E family)
MGRQEFAAFAAAATTRLYRTAYLMVGDHHRAEDLVQDVLARLYVAWPRIHGDPHGYAYRTMANAAANQRRWAHRHPDPALPDVEPGSRLPAFDDEVATQGTVVAALRQLPAQQRVIVVLRYYVDLTEAQTAAALSISVGTVKSHHARAVQRLRELLGEELVLSRPVEPRAPAVLGTSEALRPTDGSPT